MVPVSEFLLVLLHALPASHLVVLKAPAAPCLSPLSTVALFRLLLFLVMLPERGLLIPHSVQK
jgi:hypothetical protein